MKSSIGIAVATLVAMATAPVQAAPAGAATDSLRAGTLPTSYTQFGGYGRRGYGGRGYGYGQARYGRGYGYRRGGGVGTAVGAGLLGFAAGTVIGGAVASSQARAVPVYASPVYGRPVGGGAVTYCQQRYQSYDAYSGTYLGYDGLRHGCP